MHLNEMRKIDQSDTRGRIRHIREDREGSISSTSSH